ncbi:hypothetical protein RFI_25127 [Reticulomyxa filosa]|uniref:Uncharacterized protein n=1 Tax=Reticulomyxa filosa TaxID=46433 RepID=X6MFP9_RETFI|nr:hypothetical protein RFI_25127 [Reticulomyxa filosa]|eukprot:ETO12247.1 hypothetical protein RFI_25127 [Reticulomyxa filosa]
MTLYGEKQLYSNSSLNTSLKICNGRSCEGNGVVYRTSFALFVFFVIHVIFEFARIASILFFNISSTSINLPGHWDVSDSILNKIQILENDKSQNNNNNKCKICWYEILLTMITLFLQGCCITLWTLMLLWYGQTGCTLHQIL